MTVLSLKYFLIKKQQFDEIWKVLAAQHPLIHGGDGASRGTTAAHPCGELYGARRLRRRPNPTRVFEDPGLGTRV